MRNMGELPFTEEQEMPRLRNSAIKDKQEHERCKTVRRRPALLKTDTRCGQLVLEH